MLHSTSVHQDEQHSRSYLDHRSGHTLPNTISQRKCCGLRMKN